MEFWVPLLEAALRLAVPILFVALGELLAERAGVVNIGIEGLMLAGCLAGAMGAHASGSPWLGLLAAAAAGAVLGALFALLAIYLGADAIVVGAGMNLFALGGTGFIYRAVYVRTGAELAVPTFGPVQFGPLSGLPVLGQALSEQSAPTYLAVAAVVVVALVLQHTGFGLRLRAAGAAPEALAATGTGVVAMRTAAVVAGGALAGFGGGVLVLAHAGTFVEGITAGRGFIALALVICAGWRPLRVIPVALLFGAALALQYRMQALGSGFPYQLVRMVPYIATLAVLALTAGATVRAPAALGRPYRRRP